MSSNREYKQAVHQYIVYISDTKDAFFVGKSQLPSLCQVNPAKARSSDPKSVDLWGISHTRGCLESVNTSRMSSMSLVDLKPLSDILHQKPNLSKIAHST